MKNTLKNLGITSLMFSASIAGATDWIFDSSIGNVKLSESFGSADTANSGYWYYMSDETKKYIEGASILASDNLIFGSSTENFSTRTITVDTDFTFNNETMNAYDYTIPITLKSENKSDLTINGTLTRNGNIDKQTTITFSNFGTLTAIVRCQ